MASGIRATVSFDDPACCPVFEALQGTGAAVVDARSSIGGPDAGPSVTDVALTDAPSADGVLAPLYPHGDGGWYRLARDGAAGCPCERLGALGVPVVRYGADADRLTLVFHAADFEALRTAVADLREAFPDMDIRRFVRAPDGGEPRDEVVVDRARLTDRQREVLATALELGYFERPRAANATEVAAALDISPSTFGEHLATAQRKLVGAVLDPER